MSTKIALIIGGSGGIGSTVTKSLAEDGYYVYINCRNKEKGDRLLEEIVSLGGDGSVLVFDITSQEEIKNAVSNMASDKIDVLVNNAGVLRDDIIFNIKMDDWKLVFNTNFAASLKVYKAFEKKLINSEDPIVINMCSISGIRPRKGQLSYGVTKSMLISWTKTISDINKDIVYYAVSPGPVETDLIKSTKWYKDPKAVKRIPLGRYAKPDEIGQFVAFLSKNLRLFKSGSNLVLDGGFLQTTKE